MNKNNLKDLIIMNVTGFSKNQLFFSREIPDKFQEEIDEKLARLEAGEPLEYILKNAEFYSLDFYVDSRVLIPRDDTEVMVREVIKSIKAPPCIPPQVRGKANASEQGEFTLIDVGTGSGAIPISILKNTDKVSRCYAVELSEDALEVAKINAERHGLQDKIELIEGNLLQLFIPPLNPLPSKEGKRATLSLLGRDTERVIITANLPYIRTGDYKNMDSEVIFYEPDLALYGGEETGFELYEKLINQCFQLKQVYCHSELVSESGKDKNTNYDPETSSGGQEINLTLFIEIGYDQYEYSKSYLENLSLRYEYFKDNGGVWRCVKIEF